MKFWYCTFLICLQHVNLSVAKEREKMLISTDKRILLHEIGTKNYTVVKETSSRCLESDFHLEMQRLFYVTESRIIHSANLITKEEQIVLQYEAAAIKFIAVDWITDTLYFTDSLTKYVEVSTFDGLKRSILFNRVGTRPRGLCLAPLFGLMFFTTWGDFSAIFRMNMDGDDVRVIANTTVPSIIAFDGEQLYWFDALKLTLSTSKLDGSQSRVIFHAQESNFNHIFAMTVLNGRLYFSNFDGNMISSCEKVNGSNCRTELEGLTEITSIKRYGRSTQPFVNSGCHTKNGGCNHMCLLSPTGYKCVCPTGYRLLRDDKTCADSVKHFILVATKSKLVLVSMDTSNRFPVKLPLKISATLYGFDYDPIDEMVYWTEVGGKYGVIRRARLNGSAAETIVPYGYTQPDHLAVDWIARNLYWTCPLFHKIYVSHLNGTNSTAIIDDGLDKPRGIVVDPKNGRLYWSDWSKTNPKIEASDLDGENRTTLVNEKLIWPNGIAIDCTVNRLYWVDAGTNRMQYYDLTTNTCHTLPFTTPHMFGISVLENTIYWTDWNRRSLYYVNLNSLTDRKQITNELPDIMGVRVFNSNFDLGTNPCYKNAKGCGQFCFYKPTGLAKCSCATDFFLQSDGKSCEATSSDYLLYSTKSSIMSIMLESQEIISDPKVLDERNAISHVAAHNKHNPIIWVQRNPNYSVIKATLFGKMDDSRVLLTEYYAPISGLAVDWISGNIYWSYFNRIVVTRLNGKYRRTVVQSNRKAQAGLMVVNPTLRMIYWNEYQEEKERSLLYEASLSGDNERLLRNMSGRLTGLTVDINDSSLYWIKEYSAYLEHYDVLQDTHRTVLGGLSLPTGLVVFKERLYVCEHTNSKSVSGTIASVQKSDGMNKTVSDVGNMWCRDLAILRDVTQKAENVCSENNGGCEQLCFAISNTKRKCACETHYRLNEEDNTTCLEPPLFILISEQSAIYRVVLSELSETTLHFRFSLDITSIQYNLKNKKIYWLGRANKNISYSDPLGKRAIVDLGFKCLRCIPNSFGVDFFTNLMYWIDARSSTIRFVHLEKPRVHGVVYRNTSYTFFNLVILPEKSMLFFVSSHMENGLHRDAIERIVYNGLHQMRLHEFPLRNATMGSRSIYDLTVDHLNGRVYWLKKLDGVVESVSIYGGDKRLQVTLDRDKYAHKVIRVFGEYIYWLDYKPVTKEGRLKRALLDKRISRDIHNLGRNYSRTTDLLIVNLSRSNVDHPCKLNNGGCSHICYLATRNGEPSAACACPEHFVFRTNVTCERRDDFTCPHTCDNVCVSLRILCTSKCNTHNGREKCICSLAEYQCSETERCISKKLTCNHYKDCSNGDDEAIALCGHTKSNRTVVTIAIDPGSSDSSKYTAGIIAGSIVTAFMFMCLLYVFCKIHQHRVKKLNKEQSLNGCKFDTLTEKVFVLPGRSSQDTKQVITVPSNYFPPSNFRYVSGSSTNLTDDLKMFNPPPSPVTTMTDITRQTDDYYGYLHLSAPPATPLYVPSDVESMVTVDDINYLDESICRYCVQDEGCEQNAYRSRPTPSLANDDIFESSDTQSNSPPPSLASGQTSSSMYLNIQMARARIRMERSLSAISESPCNEHRMSHVESMYGPVPSLASDISYSSCQTNRGVSDCYNTYAPPPSPGTECLSVEYDVFEEACEIDFLMEASQPLSEQKNL